MENSRVKEIQQLLQEVKEGMEKAMGIFDKWLVVDESSTKQHSVTGS